MLSAATTSLRQIRALARAGIIDPRHPAQILRTARTMRAFGPIAGGIRSSARRAPDRIALVCGDAVSYTHLTLPTILLV